jgi:crotonobetainyl-CoA:carnitine CoA-transferase CaiB-like acyl-CoA transferase
MFGAFAVAGALFQRAQTGRGAHLDLSLLDCQVSLLSYMAQYYWTDGRVPGPQGTAHASVVPYQALATSDGHLIVAVFAEKFWGGFCRAAGKPEWERDPRFVTNRDRVAHRTEFGDELAALFRTRTTHDWLTRLHAEGVPAAPILSVDQVLSDPQVRHRDMVVDLQHPHHGVVPTLGTPIKFQPPVPFTPAPPATLGQHTDAILTDLLKYPAARIAALRRAGAIV